MDYIQLSLFGRTSLEHSAQTKEATSEKSSSNLRGSKTSELMYLNLKNGLMLVQSWEMDTLSLGDSSTLEVGEYPKDVVESSLSQILEESVQAKYFLSPEACSGIIRRAEKRGKELPSLLRYALEYQSRICDVSDLLKHDKREAETCVYNGASVTSKHNRVNVKAGDPCHTLSTDSRNILAQRLGIENHAKDKESAYRQDRYDEYNETDFSATLKRNGSNYGGGSETLIIQ